ncbi:carbohydrate sulfotransferase 11-like [Lineus longissimus]|uniref:carbohydrate sulfotransferase 11-like n=1 Tax=Lineus longissimus TaxID=88925 RepID=UPI00315D5123
MNNYCNTMDQKTRDKYKEKNKPPYAHVLVDDKRKFMFCTIAKVACSNWKRLMLGLYGAEDPFDRRSVRVKGNTDLKEMSLSTYSPKEIAYRLKYYTKAILVRDPLERVLSAYRNKFNTSNGPTSIFTNVYRPMIIRKYRPDLRMKIIARDEVRVSLQEFIRYITHPLDFPQLESSDHMNVHWQPYITSCDPCHVRYDIIAKYETLEEDVRFILNKINASNLIKWPARSEHYKQPPTAQLVSESFKSVSSEDLNALSSIYYHDYKIFGYKIRK